MTATVEPCCEPVLDSVLDVTEAEDLAASFKVLSDPVRLRLFNLVATAAAGEVCACDLPEAVDRSQPTVSHHLSLLVDAGFVTREQRGRWAWYRPVPARVAAMRDALAG